MTKRKNDNVVYSTVIPTNTTSLVYLLHSLENMKSRLSKATSVSTDISNSINLYLFKARNSTYIFVLQIINNSIILFDEIIKQEQ